MDDKLRLTEAYKEYYNTSRGEETQSPIEIIPVDLKSQEEVEDYKSDDNIDDVDRLVDLIRQLLQKAWNEDCPELVDTYPSGKDPEEVKMPMIVYDYYDRHHTDKTKKAPNFLKTISVGPEKYEVLLEQYEATLQFDILHDVTRGAKVMAKKFEIFLRTYIPYFKYIGISDMYFMKEPKTEPLQIANQCYARRTLIYHIKLDRYYVRRQGEAIQSISVLLNLNIGNNPQEFPGIYNVFGKELPNNE